MANLARKITKSQWHSGRVGCWLHPRSFLVIIWDYCIRGKKYQITFASWQWPFTSLICIQPSELHHVELTNLSFTKPQTFLDLQIFHWKTVTPWLVGQVWEVGISWFWESILWGTVINSQTFLGRKSQKIWNRDLSKSYYKRVKLSLTWIFECFNCFRKSMQLKINATNLCNLML